eukprot:CAMPEP_0180144822 /NCGR_PEP_ID=MMETSP0986-20121125/17230_1 /TAXON_ID=697907 /ORGANISM="non described non described, Strain CCMP2293" /LENGTH=63 /DNA_ID=CAMNT_0022088935 /DNA_START=505 /DNA_END=693 /DNA_ORIENTATION=-
MQPVRNLHEPLVAARALRDELLRADERDDAVLRVVEHEEGERHRGEQGLRVKRHLKERPGAPE